MSKSFPSPARPRTATKSQYLKCRHCGLEFSLDAPGTQHRNHCPWCLWSVHLDHTPGDRKAACSSLMKPISIALREDGEWMLVHRCESCKVVHLNRIAGDDDERTLLALAIQPITRPPFPLLW